MLKNGFTKMPFLLNQKKQKSIKNLTPFSIIIVTKFYWASKIKKSRNNNNNIQKNSLLQMMFKSKVTYTEDDLKNKISINFKSKMYFILILCYFIQQFYFICIINFIFNIKFLLYVFIIKFYFNIIITLLHLLNLYSIQ